MIIKVEKFHDQLLLGRLIFKTGVAGRKEFRLSFFSESSLVKYHQDWKKVLKKILLYFKQEETTNKYVLLETHECISFKNKDVDNTEVLQEFSKLCKTLGIWNRTFISDNNLDLKETPYFKSKPYPYFLGWNSPDVKELKVHEYERKFLFQNRLKRIHRTYLLGQFLSNDLLKSMHWSYLSANPEEWGYKRLGPPESSLDNENDTIEITDYNLKTFCNIVTETNFNWNNTYELWEGGLGNGNTFITEKVEKSLACGQPFIVASTPFFLEKLHYFGFKTFDNWWDESYDRIKDPKKRLDAIVKLVKSINALPYTKLYEMYEKMIPTLMHNQEVNHKWFKLGQNSPNLSFPNHPMHKVMKYEFDINGNLIKKYE